MDGIDKVWQVVPNSMNPEVATIIAVDANNFEIKGDVTGNVVFYSIFMIIHTIDS